MNRGGAMSAAFANQTLLCRIVFLIRAGAARPAPRRHCRKVNSAIAAEVYRRRFILAEHAWARGWR